ncbi:MAG: hypothetical protein AAF533_23940 [Acidobacteriota bacterium]
MNSWLKTTALVVIVSWLLASATRAESEVLTDAELDSIHAGGIEVALDLGATLGFSGLVDAGHPVAALAPGLEAPSEAPPILVAPSDGSATTGPTEITTPSGRVTLGFDGVDLNQITTNISLGGEALSNAQSFLNVFAGGDVSVGINLQVIIDPAHSSIGFDGNNLSFVNLSELTGSLQR